MKKSGLLLTSLLGILSFTGCSSNPNIESVKIYKGDEIYRVGDDFKTVQLSVSYDDGAKKLIDVTKDMLRGFDTSVAGEKTVLIIYEDFVIEYDITVTEYYLESISVKDDYVEEYYKFDEYKDGDATLVLSYSDKTTEELEITSSMITSFDTSKIGTSTVNVSYMNYMASYEISIIKPIVEDVVILDETETVYFVDDEFQGVTFEAQYHNGHSEVFTITDSSELLEFDTSSNGTKEVKFNFDGEEYSYQIEVRKKVSSISIKDGYQKTYEIDEEFKGATLQVNNEDGSIEEIAITSDMLEGFDTTKAGKSTLKVQYGHKETSFDVYVPLVNIKDYTESESKVFMVEIEDEVYCDLSQCITQEDNTLNKFERLEGSTASGMNTSNMGTIAGNRYVINFYSSYEGVFDLQLRVQSASYKGGSDQNLKDVMSIEYEGEITDAIGVAEASSDVGNWQNMFNWNTTTVKENIPMKKGLNTIVLISKDTVNTNIRFPNIDYVNVVVKEIH